MKEQAEKILSQAIIFLFGALVFLLPFDFFFLFPKAEFYSLNATLLRAEFFKIIVNAIIFLFVFRLLLVSEIKARLSRLSLWSVITFFLIIFLACFFALDRDSALYGLYQRQQGAFTYFYYLLIFLIAVFSFSEKKQIEKIISLLALSASLVSFVGLLEWFGISLLERGFFLPPFSRIVATIGQPVFLGNFLILVAPLSLYKIIISSSRVRRYIFGAAFFLQFSALILTYSRGSWLAVIASFFFASGLYLFAVNKRRALKISALVAIFLLIAALSSAVYTYKSGAYSDVDKGMDLLSRASSIFDLRAGSVAMRIILWQDGLESFLERPILGHGLEGQREALIGHYSPRWAVYEKINDFSDRAHNEFIEILLTAGILGLAAFVFLLFVLFRSGALFLKKEPVVWTDEKKLVFFLLVSVFGYLASIFWSFSTIETAVYFWLFLAFILIVSSEERILPFNLSSSGLFRFYLLALIPLFVLFISLSFGEWQKVKAEYYFYLAGRAAHDKDYALMLQRYEQVFALAGRESAYREAFLVHLRQGRIERIGYGAGEIAERDDFLRQALKAEEGQDTTYFREKRRAIILSLLGRENSEYFSAADSIFEKLALKSPFYTDLFYAWASAYLEKGDCEKAIQKFDYIFTLLPDLNDKYMNREHKRNIFDFLFWVYYQRGYCSARLGDYESAINNYRQALLINPLNGDLYHYSAEAYEALGDKQAAVWYNKRGDEITSKPPADKR